MKSTALFCVNVGLCGIAVLGASCSSGKSNDVATNRTGLSESRLTDSAFFDAAGCKDRCAILNRQPLFLPESGVSAESAKIVDAEDRDYFVTLDSAGVARDEITLVKGEYDAYAAHHGKKAKALELQLSSAAPDDIVDVVVWTKLKEPFAIRETLIADPVAAKAADDATNVAIAKASAPIMAKLASIGAKVFGDGLGVPAIRAQLKASAVSGIEAVAEVGFIGPYEAPHLMFCDSPGSFTNVRCDDWYYTIRADAAHTYFANSLGAGQNVCIMEGDKPADYTYLPSVTTFSSSATPSDHMQGVAGTISNLNPTRTGVAPSASLFLADTDNETGSGGTDTWCRNNNTKTINFSAGFGDGSNSPSAWWDWTKDWMVTHSPYPLWVVAAGDNGAGYPTYHYVQNHTYNALMLGGDNDENTTSRTDDQYDPFTGWGNFQTSHNDFELPQVVGPDYGEYVAGAWMNAASGATPEAAGIAAEIGSRDPTNLNAWPEAKRAIIIASATGRMNLPVLTNLGGGLADQHAGAGLIDAFQAVQMADSSNWHAPGGPIAGTGYYAKSLDLTSEFTSGTSNFQYNIFIPGSCSSARLRVVATWDATATGCNTYGDNCTGSTLDADMDLWLHASTGSPPSVGSVVCRSTTYDSNWEICDVPVVCGQQYVAKMHLYTHPASWTYFSIAWMSYAP